MRAARDAQIFVSLLRNVTPAVKIQKTHSSVVGVPEGSGGEVETHGEGEGGNESGGDKDRVSSEKGVVNNLFWTGE